MTNPSVTITTIEPSKSKTWVAVIGGLLTVAIPLILSVSEALPEPWPAVIGAVVAVLTATGVYKAPYKPQGTTVVATRDLEQIATPTPAPDVPDAPETPVVHPTPGLGGYKNPWG